MRLLLFLFVYLIFIGCNDIPDDTNYDTNYDTVILPMEYEPQDTEVWCWAAVTEMTLQYYGFNVEQCELISIAQQLDCCLYPNLCMRGGTLLEIQNLLAMYNIHSEVKNYPLSFAEIKEHIDNGRPMIISYNGSFIGHVVILKGYTSSGELFIDDPYFGQFKVPYGTSFVYGGDRVWSHTIVIK